MMSCEEVRNLMPFMLKGELEGEILAEMQTHVSYCPACQEIYSQEVALSGLLKGLRSLAPEPSASLRVRVVEALDDIDAEAREPLFSSLRMRWAASALATAFLLLIGLAVMYQPSHTDINGIIAEATMRHAKMLPLDVQTEDPYRALSWLEGKIDFGLGRLPLQSKAAELLGARLTHMKESDAAHFVFRSPLGHKISLIVFPNSANIEMPSRFVEIGGKRYYITTRRGFTIIFWKENGLIYTMVGDEPSEMMLSLLSME